MATPASAAADLQNIFSKSHAENTQTSDTDPPHEILQSKLLIWLSEYGVERLLACANSPDDAIKPEQWLQLLVSIPDKVANAIANSALHTTPPIDPILRPDNFAAHLCTVTAAAFLRCRCCEYDSDGNRSDLAATAALATKLSVLGHTQRLMSCWIQELLSFALQPMSEVSNSTSTQPLHNASHTWRHYAYRTSALLSLFPSARDRHAAVAQVLSAAVATSEPQVVASSAQLHVRMGEALQLFAPHAISSVDTDKMIQQSNRRAGVIALLFLLFGHPQRMPAKTQQSKAYSSVSPPIPYCPICGSPREVPSHTEQPLHTLPPSLQHIPSPVTLLTPLLLTSSAVSHGTQHLRGLAIRSVLDYALCDVLPVDALLSTPSVVENNKYPPRVQILHITHSVPNTVSLLTYCTDVPILPAIAAWCTPHAAESTDAAADAALGRAIIHLLLRAPPAFFDMRGNSLLASTSHNTTHDESAPFHSTTDVQLALMRGIQQRIDSPLDTVRAAGLRVAAASSHCSARASPNTIPTNVPSSDPEQAELNPNIPSLTDAAMMLATALPEDDVTDKYDADEWGALDELAPVYQLAEQRLGTLTRGKGRHQDEEVDAVQKQQQHNTIAQTNIITSAKAGEQTTSPMSTSTTGTLPTPRLTRASIAAGLFEFMETGNIHVLFPQHQSNSMHGNMLQTLSSSLPLVPIPVPTHLQKLPYEGDVDTQSAALQRQKLWLQRQATSSSASTTQQSQGHPTTVTAPTNTSPAAVVAHRLQVKSPTTLTDAIAALREENDMERVLAALATLPRLIHSHAASAANASEVLVEGPSLLHLLLTLDDRFNLPGFHVYRHMAAVALTVELGPLAVLNLYRGVWGTEYSAGTRAEMIDIVVSAAGILAHLHAPAEEGASNRMKEHTDASAPSTSSSSPATGSTALTIASLPLQMDEFGILTPPWEIYLKQPGSRNTAMITPATQLRKTTTFLSAKSVTATSSSPPPAQLNLFGEVAAEIYFYPLLRAIVRGHPYDDIAAPSNLSSLSLYPADVLQSMNTDALTLSKSPGSLIVDDNSFRSRDSHSDSLNKDTDDNNSTGHDFNTSTRYALLAQCVRALSVFLEAARFDPSVPAMTASLFSLLWPLLGHRSADVRRAAITASAAVIAAMSRFQTTLHAPSVVSQLPPPSLTHLQPIVGASGGINTSTAKKSKTPSSLIVVLDEEEDASNQSIDDDTKNDTTDTSSSVLHSLARIGETVEQRDVASRVLLAENATLQSYRNITAFSSETNRNNANPTQRYAALAPFARTGSLDTHANNIRDNVANIMQGNTLWSDLCELAAILRILAERDTDDGVRTLAINILQNDTLKQLVMGPFDGMGDGVDDGKR